VTNYVVVALDEATVEGMKERGVNCFYMPLKVGTGWRGWGRRSQREATWGAKEAGQAGEAAGVAEGTRTDSG
jgi:hypothetical protein